MEMKEKNKGHVNVLLLAAVILFAVLSLFGGIDEIRTPIGGGLSGEPSMLERISFAPVFCCSISLIEVLLLLLGRGIPARAAGLTLNILKISLPTKNARFMMMLFSGFGGKFSYEYRLNTYGWCLVGFGIVIAVLYLLDISVKWKEKKDSGETLDSILQRYAKGIRILLLIGIAVFAALSFFGGIQKEVPETIVSGGKERTVHMIYELGYLPWSCLTLSVLEICLLLFGKSIMTESIGAAAHIVNMILPPLWYLWMKSRNTDPETVYSISSFFVKLMVILGLIILLLYAFEILNRRKKEDGLPD